jgi:hypothetical protein
VSAAEIIEMIKKLPPEERAEVVAFLLSEESAGRVEEPAAGKEVRCIPLAEAQRIAEGIFDRHSELFKKLAQ